MGHKQNKRINMVIQVSLFVSSKPRCQADWTTIDILKFSLAARLRGHKQRNLNECFAVYHNDWVRKFLLLMPRSCWSATAVGRDNSKMALMAMQSNMSRFWRSTLIISVCYRSPWRRSFVQHLASSPMQHYQKRGLALSKFNEKSSAPSPNYDVTVKEEEDLERKGDTETSEKQKNLHRKSFKGKKLTPLKISYIDISHIMVKLRRWNSFVLSLPISLEGLLL